VGWGGINNANAVSKSNTERSTLISDAVLIYLPITQPKQVEVIVPSELVKALVDKGGGGGGARGEGGLRAPVGGICLGPTHERSSQPRPGRGHEAMHLAFFRIWF
jgi:hypothetical protein